jgi:hypothetical protein
MSIYYTVKINFGKRAGEISLLDNTQIRAMIGKY